MNGLRNQANDSSFAMPYSPGHLSRTFIMAGEWGKQLVKNQGISPVSPSFSGHMLVRERPGTRCSGAFARTGESES
jgi:hypothetical protein